MSSQRAAIPAKHLFNGFRTLQGVRSSRHARAITTEAHPNEVVSLPPSPATVDTTAPVSEAIQAANMQSNASITRATPFLAQQNPFRTTSQCMLYTFPRFEPVQLINYPDTHLGLPLRKDILHRAVIFEGDNTRQGTASTKWRSEVHGSGRKIRPQKGTGHARLGDKKSPMLRGGGVAFGPKPRDFGTDLPEKIYDLAWRTALSYRYRMGQLMVLDGVADIKVHPDSRERYMMDLLRHNKMDFDNGRTLFVTLKRRDGLFAALEAGAMGHHARALDVPDVDVKDLLELGRVVVERSALDIIFQQHESDVAPDAKLVKWRAAQS